MGSARFVFRCRRKFHEKKDDMVAAVTSQAFPKMSEQLYVFYRDSEKNWDDTFSNDVRNYTGNQTKAVFTYAEYAPSTVCVTPMENVGGEWYGYMEISYLDSEDELKQADARIDAKLAALSSLSMPDKLLAIADHVCSLTKYGSETMPDGGYDTINGVYDVLHGVHTNVVCTSYAVTFQRFMERAGMESFILSNVGHAWNIVKVDGKWYGVDCTQDAGSSIERSSFLMGRSTMQRAYSTDRLNPVAIFGKTHTIAEDNYQSAVTKPTEPTKKPTAPTSSVTNPPANTTSSSTTETSVVETIDSTMSTTSTETKQPASSVADKKTGVKISAEEGVLPPDTQLVVAPADYKLADAAGKFVAFDISLENGGGKIQPDGRVRVSIPIPDGYDRDRLTVYYIAEDGAKAEMPSAVAGNTITFETDHFSLYVVTEKTAVQTTGGSPVLWIVLGIVLLAAAGGGFALWWFKFRRKVSTNRK